MKAPLIALAFSTAALVAQDPQPTVSIDRADRTIPEILDAAAAQLGWNILCRERDFGAAKLSGARLELPRADARAALSGWLHDHRLALVPLVPALHLYSVVSLVGPRKSLASTRAVRRSPDQVVAERDSGAWVWTVVPLQHAEPGRAARGLRGDAPRNVVCSVWPLHRALFLHGPVGDVATLVDTVRRLDRPAPGAQETADPAAPDAPAPDVAAALDALEREITAVERTGAWSAPALEIAAGSHALVDLLHDVQDGLDWCVLADERDLARARAVRLQNGVHLDRDEALSFVSQVLLDQGFALTVIDRDLNLFCIVEHQGPRRGEIAQRSELVSADRALALRSAAIGVTAFVPLRHDSPLVVRNALGPLLAAIFRTPFTLATIGNEPTMLVRGLAPEVVVALEVIAEFDRPPNDAGPARRIAALRGRVAALERRRSTAPPSIAAALDAPRRFRLPSGRLSLRALLQAAERTAGAPFRLAETDARAPGIVLPREVSFAQEDVAQLVAKLATVYGFLLVPGEQDGYEAIAVHGPQAKIPADRAVDKTPDEVLAMRTVPMPIRTELRLTRLDPVAVVRGLIPLLRGGSVTPRLALESDPPRLVITALAPQAAALVELLRAADSEPAAPSVVEELAALRARVRAAKPK